ncbi:MAG: ParB/RepB/Spo0J family partition protein [Selenomonas sp.]|uniref:ParB/RepB/Spo0J family partition protein n=1 Tax=Selenomonas sp. TaxID=2053611 RepID=UPI0025EABB39|nr:ParB/RepB/Spo0J family partition protein [Selenomonas sp.]MCI6086816.1 ParB/RepB/Spo0J family partition protein [Selenomonas sp.]
MSANKHGGLGGKGLGAFFDQKPVLEPKADRVLEIPMLDIYKNRFQPRTDFDEAALEELRASIASYGVLQPILVRKSTHGYELIAGERRWRAAKLAGLEKIPALVREYNDAETSEIALIENLQREDLNPMEESRAYQSLIDTFHFTQDSISQKVGRSRSHIANFLRLQKLDAKVQDYVSTGTLTMGQARPLVAIEDHDLQRKAADYIQEHELTARGCERLVKELEANPQLLDDMDAVAAQTPEQKAADNSTKTELRAVIDRLTEYFGTQVNIQHGKKKGKIVIDYYGDDDLTRILSLLHGDEKNNADSEAEKQRKIEALRKVSTQGFTV